MKIEFSFDDGFDLDIKAVEMLQKVGLTATIYIIVDKVGQPGFLTWNQILDLDDQGIEIGSHTVTHPQDLKALFDDVLFFEVQNSKEMLETVLNKKVTKFCYPRGRADERVISFVKEAGYLEARGTGKPGITDKSNPFYLPGTIHIFQRPEYEGKPVLEFAKEVLDKGGDYINIWGHTKEIDENNLWEVLEEVIQHAKNKLTN